MACKQWNPVWIARLYGELDPDESRILESHLAGCETCRNTLARLSGVRTTLRESMPAPPGAPRVVVLGNRRRWSNAWSFAAGIACATLVLLAGAWSSPQAELREVHQRLSQLETADGARESEDRALLTRSELLAALERVERRFDRERAQDLEYLLRVMSASELRTGTWIDRTQEALTYLAMREGPGVSER